MIRFQATAAIVAACLFSACGLEPHLVAAPSESCAENTAVVTIGDGYTQSLCGCEENGADPSMAVTAVANESLTCTIDAGAFLVFHFVSTKLRHQVFPADGDSFPAGPVSDPNTSLPVRSHRIGFTETGSFDFIDAFNPAVGGTIVVN